MCHTISFSVRAAATALAGGATPLAAMAPDGGVGARDLETKIYMGYFTIVAWYE